MQLGAVEVLPNAPSAPAPAPGSLMGAPHTLLCGRRDGSEQCVNRGPTEDTCSLTLEFSRKIRERVRLWEKKGQVLEANRTHTRVHRHTSLRVNTHVCAHTGKWYFLMIKKKSHA